MAKAAEVDQRERAQKPNGVDIWNAVILTITMIAVVIYACEAHRQSNLILKSVRQEVMINRPALVPNGVTEVGADPIPKEVSAHLRNFGKSLAIDVKSTGEIVMAAKGPPYPRDPVCEDKWNPPANLAPTAVASDNTNNYLDSWPHWIAGQAQDISDYNRGKTLYAIGCVWYRSLDNELYYTDICTYWDPKNGNSFAFCIAPDRNVTY